MRAQTPSFVVSVKLLLPEPVQNHLKKSFRIANSAYNEALSFGLLRFEAMKQNPTYQELLDSRRVLLAKSEKKQETKEFKAQMKELNRSLVEIRKDYSLTEFGLSHYLSQQRRKPGSVYEHLNSGELQVVAGQVIKTLEKVIFYQIESHKVRFRSKYDSDMSFCNRVNSTGTRLVESDKTGIAYRLFIHKASTFVDIPVKAFNHYQQMSILRSERIKYVQIVRKTIRGKKMYYLQIVCEGYPPAKCSFKRLSNRAVRLLNRRRKTYRSLSEERKKLQGQLITQLVSQAAVIKIEELNIKGLQKRAKDTRINPKTNRPFSKKRFGNSIFRAAPSAFR